ncbi:endo-1,4-beta-xylanase [Thermotoga sp. SG1]|uniref:endo-1,4-beta-xylanase n=1 Tax=Thermotoga sp. SG1 TaxID=126739 RepID=UPI000C78B7E0|nr:endo-1,4-beta-xylanase [Thermotoga sp. SG1]PLV57660.1 1,4-beta-xylanase [Thermotoga sp. SG1]
MRKKRWGFLDASSVVLIGILAGFLGVVLAATGVLGFGGEEVSPFETALALSFEGNTDGASPFGKDVVVTASQDVAADGEYSLKVENRTSVWDGVEIDLTGKVNSGADYLLSFQVYQTSDSPQLFSVLARTEDEKGERYEILVDKVAVPNYWKEILVPFSPTFEGTPAKFSLIITSPKKTDFIFYVDNVRVLTPKEAGPKVVYETSFEKGLGEWQPRGGDVKISISSKVAHSGKKSLFVSNRQKGWHGTQINLKGILKTGKTYAFEAWAYQESGQDQTIIMTMQRKYSSDANTQYEWIKSSTVPSGQWVQLSGTYTIPAGVTVEDLTLYFESQNPTLEFYVDDVKVVDTTSAEIKLEMNPEEEIPALREVLKDYFRVGVALPSKVFINQKDLTLITKHFNSITAENEMKPDSLLAGIENGKLKFRFETADKYIEFAQQNGMVVRGHTLVWHNQTPEWFFKDENGNLLSKEAMTERLREYIHTVVGHFKGKVYAWDVVNEAVDPNQPDGLRRSTWYQIMGPDYIELAFKFAREADPDAKLFYNDYNTFEPKKRDIIYNLVKSLKEKGLIDGIGMQCHISLATDIRQIEEAIKKFSSIPGIEIHITELDMSVYRDSTSNYPEAPRNALIEQAHKMAQLFEIFKKYSNVITNVTFWGLKDDYSWRATRRNDWTLIFDKDYQAKLAYWAIVAPEVLPPLSKESKISEGEAVVVGMMDDSYMMSMPIEIYDEEGNVKATIRAVWKDSTIYVYGEVQDRTKKPAEDGVAIFINPNNERTPYLQSDDTYVVLWTNWKSEVNREDVEVKKFVGPGFRRYSFEMSIKIAGVEYKKDSYIGFDIAVIDDGKWYSWSDTTNSQKTNTMNYGVLKLEGVMVATAKYGTPVIDGDIDEIWNTTEEIETKSVAMGSLEKNATAKVRVLWDEENLYVLAVVKDPVLNKDNSNPWEQDSVEIFIDENNHKTGYYENDDAQFRVNYMNEQSFGTGASAARFKTAVKLIEGGYIVEAAIKWKTIKPSPDTVIGFNVQVNDANEKGQRVGIISWSDPTNNSWRDPSKFGNLRLIK